MPPNPPTNEVRGLVTRPGPGPGPGPEAAGLGRSIALASAAAVPLVLVVVTAGLLAIGTSIGSSLGVGVFAALWGGGGFGAMIGGVLFVHRRE